MVEEGVVCTADVQQCPDGSEIGRSGPNCEFVCPGEFEAKIEEEKIESSMTSRSGQVTISGIAPGDLISSPLTVKGKAKGIWFSEGFFPVVLLDGKGDKIFDGLAAAKSEWMTSEFVPYVVEFTFINPYVEGATESMKKGTLILKKSNPSGAPELSDSLEIPVIFAQ